MDDVLSIWMVMNHWMLMSFLMMHQQIGLDSPDSKLEQVNL
jgi:hypothetical protein